MNAYTEKQGDLTCKLEEKLDSLACQKLEWELDMRINEYHKNIVFDLENVEYISSTFIRICIKMVKLIGKERFYITHANPNVMNVFSMANLTDICR